MSGPESQFLRRRDKARLSRGVRPLDLTPEQEGERRGLSLGGYVADRVAREHRAEYMRRYLRAFLRSVEGHVPGVKARLARDLAGQEPGTGDGLPDAGTFAYTLAEHVADQAGDEAADGYLAGAVREIMEIVPVVREAVVADLLTELSEEVARRAPSTESHATVELLREIERDWRNRA